MQVLLVDDDRTHVQRVVHLLTALHYEVVHIPDGRQALALIEQRAPDTVILEAQLPDGSGFDLCQQIRQISQVPILFLARAADVSERVRGLQAGADDYLPKQIDPLELIARLEAVLRRGHHGSRVINAARTVAGMTLLPEIAIALLPDAPPIRLTPLEVRLLSYLMDHVGIVVSHSQLLAAVDDALGVGTDTRTVMGSLARLRHKLQRGAGRSPSIQFMADVGYRLECDPFAPPEKLG